MQVAAAMFGGAYCQSWSSRLAWAGKDITMLINLVSHIMRSLWGPLHCYMQIVQRILMTVVMTASTGTDAGAVADLRKAGASILDV